ncbi:PTS system glucose-specific IIA component [Clostridium tetanomorphum]|uniref:PTS sugar transporter subunit IIA n=1 Tax=Clostridium tetanomorphum TaxID=1553 RepID=UPI0004504681|nr:PTS glucose transporter subunit IIA [Clostridium tetanomorphum]KAJ53441.1 PTS system sucrose-specific transporter subunit II A [Clostridium tetanomorphum DSM 665]MBP1865330.1 PTS system glucose-specific IIA component [Clostridium tetanomorphum]NRS85253.1 PTS system glucose-specific IIA component [Clostridium tetanomorphum]NRZ98430.1 PTS system glucose-specific IIA component [Clostridium tetanomorphum]SQC03037.1 PTS system transporter subunit IIABC [Clostridium tetanomorphum]
MFNFFKKNKEDKNAVEIRSPFVGKCFKVDDIPDEVFASNMMGEGIGFESKDGILYSPVEGEILQVFPTKHAIVMKSKEGLEILLHIGIDTVGMKGEGFESFVKSGDKVKPGDKLISFDLNLINEKAKSTLSPMVITNKEIIDNIDFNYGEVDENSIVCKINIKE